MKNIVILGDSMKINELNIKSVGNISDLTLNFNQNMNVICGTNGIGKTTILNALTFPFANHFDFQSSVVRTKMNNSKGLISLIVANGSENIPFEATIVTKGSSLSSSYYVSSQLQHVTKQLINFSIKRNIDYKEMESINKDPDREDTKNGLNDIIREGLNEKNIKNWLVNRDMIGADPERLSDAERKNYELMKAAFSILDKNVEFIKADHKTFEVILNDRGNEIFFEYESAGYKAIIFIILGIISEIEFRFKDICAQDFEGVILIDEIDMHLHPVWQKEIIRVLKKTFPKTQFILTTHSPSVLQDLDKDEIIPLQMDDDFNVKVKQLSLSDYGLKGWTLEEILSDVMGVEYTNSNLYKETMKDFEFALDCEDTEKIKQSYHKLDQMLHPQNPLRQILSIQMAGFEND